MSSRAIIWKRQATATSIPAFQPSRNAKPRRSSSASSPALRTTVIDVALAEHNKISAIYPFRLYIIRGGLMSYDADPFDLDRQVGVDYVGRILRGAKPADLPVRSQRSSSWSSI